MKIMFDCCRYTGKFYHGYEFIVGMIVVNLFIFLLIIPIEKTFIYLPYICIADVALIFVYYIIFLYIRHYHRANKIEDAIQYGIIGTKVCNNSCYKEDEGKSYKIKKHQYKYSYIDSCSFGQESYSKYYGVLDLFDKNTNEYVKSVTEEELWEMIKKVRCRNSLTKKVLYLSYFEILYPTTDSTVKKH